MAKRRKGGFKSKGGGRGRAMDGLLAGVAGGVGANLGSQFLGPIGAPVGLAAAGHFMGSDTLLTLAGVQVGQVILAGGLGGMGTSGGQQVVS